MIAIRPLRTFDEYRACEDLQRRVWAMPGDLEIVPLHMLMPVHDEGGLLLGAFDGDELVGFVFGYLGRIKGGGVKLCSHMMGVASGYQSAGLGYRLKLAQRVYALEQGYDLVTWTYDPLQSRNAYLNIHKLGCICRTYAPDYYGPLSDGLNAGLPTDRFKVEWWIASDAVQRRLIGTGAGRQDSSSLDGGEQVNRVVRTEAGILAPGELLLDRQSEVLRVGIPADYGAVKAADPGLALAWRLAMRQTFQTYFAAGYTVVDFESHRLDGERRSTYVLRRLEVPGED